MSDRRSTSLQPRNRRAARTRARLVQAFIELILTRGYEGLSAQQVAARAGVGRSTFYVHFGGLGAMLEAGLEVPCAVLAASVRSASPASDLAALMGHFRQHWVRNRGFFCEPVLSLWVRRLSRDIALSLRRDPDCSRQRPVIARECLAPLLAELQLSMIRGWLAAGAKASPESIAQTVRAVTGRLLYGI
jgi:AcrR family transcriptional regulator